MRMLVALIVAGLLVNAAQAESNYKLNAENTKIEFVGTKPDGKHEGSFKKLKGTAVVADGMVKNLEVTIQIDSMVTDNEKLTQHLLSPDFFDAATYPKAVFKLNNAEKTDDGCQLTGELKMHGVTKEVSFPATVETGDQLTIKAKFTINRNDWNISYGQGKIDDDVQLTLTVNASK